MFIDFKSFMEFLHYQEGWLLCLYFKSKASGMSTKKPFPENEEGVLFDDFLWIDKYLSFVDVIKKPNKLGFDWKFVAVSITDTDKSLSEIKYYLSDMRKKLVSEFKYLYIFDKEGYYINPSKIE